MTNKEAVLRIKDHIEAHKVKEPVVANKIHEALELAIGVLSSERLTKRVASCYKDYVDCVSGNRDCSSIGACDSCNIRINQLAKLAHLEELQDENRLIELPMRDNQTVYAIEQYEIVEVFITNIDIHYGHKDGIKFFGMDSKNNRIEYDFDLSDIGVCVYSTREEAEATIAERSGNE